MPDDPINVSPIIATIPYTIIRQKATKKRFRRGTYNFANAVEFKPVFDQIIQSNYTEQCIIPYAQFPHNVPGTIYLKCCDALRWLSLFHEPMEERYKYETLSNSYTLTREFIDPETKLHPLGVGLKRKAHAVRLVQTITTKEHEEIINSSNKILAVNGGYDDVNDWKLQIQNYMVDEDKFGKRLTIQLALFGAPEKEWLENMLSTARNIMEIDYISGDSNEITIMKERKNE